MGNLEDYAAVASYLRRRRAAQAIQRDMAWRVEVVGELRSAQERLVAAWNAAPRVTITHHQIDRMLSTIAAMSRDLGAELQVLSDELESAQRREVGFHVGGSPADAVIDGDEIVEPPGRAPMRELTDGR